MSVAGPARYLVLLFLGLGACPAGEASVPEALTFGPGLSLPAPSPGDGDDRCLELADQRVCWSADGAPRLVSRPLPPLQTPGGWRCWGEGSGRRCRPRGAGPGPWHCEPGSGCRRGHPRRPDDGEWECTEVSGVVVCRTHGISAGVIAGSPDPGWLCGGEPRICVDFSPDFPPPDAEDRFACRFPFAPGEPRACVADPGARRVGDLCPEAGACPVGTACLVGRCLPTRPPAPTCWTDKDCGEGRACSFGTCTEAAR